MATRLSYLWPLHLLKSYVNLDPWALTHLIQFFHISDDLSGVFHLQHCCSHHHSLLLVLQLRQRVMNTMLLHICYYQRSLYVTILHTDINSTFFNSLFLASFPAKNVDILLAFLNENRMSSAVENNFCLYKWVLTGLVSRVHKLSTFGGRG